MLITDTHYYNAYLDKDGQPLIEGHGLGYFRMLEDIIDTEALRKDPSCPVNLTYAYTLKVTAYDSKKMDMKKEAIAEAIARVKNQQVQDEMEALYGGLPTMTHAQVGIKEGRA